MAELFHLFRFSEERAHALLGDSKQLVAAFYQKFAILKELKIIQSADVFRHFFDVSDKIIEEDFCDSDFRDVREWRFFKHLVDFRC